jgi:hypothetical protein
MLAFDEYVHARGAGLVQLGFALSGNPRVARELALEALVRARRQWNRIHDQPDEAVEQELVQAYLAWWRRPPRPRADHPFATLGRTERAVLALRLLRGHSAEQIADIAGLSSAAVRRHLDAHPADKAALSEFADILHPPGGLGDAIDAKARALTRRRTAIGGGVAVVVLAAAGIFGATRPANVVPVPTETPPRPTPSAVPIRFVPAAFVLPDFPYEPTYLPRDPGEPRVYKTARDLLLEYPDISITLSPTQPSNAGTPELVTVQGRSAKLFSGVFNGNLDIAIVWAMNDQWMTVHTFNIVKEEAILIAEQVRPGRVAMQPPPFTFTIAPEDFTLTAANPERLCIGRGTTVVAGRYGLCVNLAEAKGLQDLPANNLQHTTVNGQRVDVADFDGLQSELRLFLADGRVLVVSQNALNTASKLSADELVRFAAAVRVGPIQA